MLKHKCHLEVHLRAVHAGERRQKCAPCDGIFDRVVIYTDTRGFVMKRGSSMFEGSRDRITSPCKGARWWAANNSDQHMSHVFVKLISRGRSVRMEITCQFGRGILSDNTFVDRRGRCRLSGGIVSCCMSSLPQDFICCHTTCNCLRMFTWCRVEFQWELDWFQFEISLFYSGFELKTT